MRVHVIWAEGLSICHWRGETIDQRIQIPLYQVLPSFITSTDGWTTCYLANRPTEEETHVGMRDKWEEHSYTDRFRRGALTCWTVYVCLFYLSVMCFSHQPFENSFHWQMRVMKFP